MRYRTLIALAALAAATASHAAGLQALEAGPREWTLGRGQSAIERQVAVEEPWDDAAGLHFRAALGGDTLEPVRLFVCLVTAEGLWYQSAQAVELDSRRWVAVGLDLGGESGYWVPRGQLRPWDERVRRSVRAVGLKAFHRGGFAGSVLIARMRVKRTGSAERPGLRLLDFEAPRRVRVGERCEIRFRLPREFENPFDPAEVTVQGLFMPPGGETDYRLVPGFFTQDHFPRWEGGAERWVPAGLPAWCIRFWPDRPGSYRCRIVVRTREAEARVPWTFEVDAAPGGAPPRPRPMEDVPASDFVVSRDYNGRDTIYIHRPGGWRADARTPPAGPIHAWRVPLEWTERWGGYGGLGRYNMAVASAFDELLDRAAARGLALPLALTCNEPFGERAKYNWKDNPLAAANGGPLDAPSAFFTRPEAWTHFRLRSRYVLARWGGHPAVAAWELWCTMPANGADSWHARAGEHLATYRLGPKDIRSHHPQTTPPAAFATLNTFRQEEREARERWVAHSVIQHTIQSVQPTRGPATDGPESLEVVASYPGEAAILRPVEADWHEYDRLAFDVFVPAEAPNDMRVMVYLRDGDLWWYETLLPTYLRPGDWTKLLVDLSGETTEWVPQGHQKVFDRYALQRVRVLGLRVFGHRPYRGPLYVDNIQLWRDGSRPPRLKVTHQMPNRVNVPRHGLFELTFRLSRTFANPFDPACADIVGHFTAPSGATLAVPAFFTQDYERHLVEGREVLTPKGRSAWKLRFTPTETGTYTYSVTVNGHELPAIRGHHFDCVPSDRPGFVRRSTRDPRFFELSTGQFYYPIGINLRSPSDNRKPYPLDYELPEGKGTFIYDAYFKQLAAAGVNWVRIWQCPWWCGLEWTKKWPGFQGLGRYNLESAWRFDYLLDQAAARGLYVQVCLTNHGQIVIDRHIDRQWDSNPLNADLGEGGPLQDASAFYTNERARQLFKQRLRYTVARWGYHPHLMAFSLFSEMEFTKAYWNDAGARGDNSVNCPPVQRWVREMATTVKRLDPFGHLVTTHFSHPWRGHDVWAAAREELDFVQSNAYSTFYRLYGPFREHRGVVDTNSYYYDGLMGRFDLPILIAEYGGHWMKNPPELLDAELHAGIWTSITSPMAGSTGYWWWLHVHFKDKVHHYRAATRYMAGEDWRGLGLRPAPLAVHGGPLQARAMRSDRHAYVWVYHPQVQRALDGVPPVDGATLVVPDLAPGAYQVEVWDTYKGQPVQRRDLRTDGSTLRVDLPQVRGDVALKIRPARGG